MKKGNKTTKGKQQPERAPVQPAGVTELTEYDLEQVQGGFGASNPSDNRYPIGKEPKGPSQINDDWTQ